jgi:hypothetical protein
MLSFSHRTFISYLTLYALLTTVIIATVFAELFYRNGTEELAPEVFQGSSPRSGYPHGWVLKERTTLSEMKDIHDLGRLRDQFLDSNRRFMVRLVDERIAIIQTNARYLNPTRRRH